jgi:murein DD-endopeptidase MepM/ murein hydrolase activator NlpD
VVDFDEMRDQLLALDFTAANTALSEADVADTERFSKWVDGKLSQHQCRYGIGGYMEHRTLYGRSSHFDSVHEPRRLHLGVDIWASAGTPVYAAFDGKVHSFKDNDHFGDYGPTIILEHDLDGLKLYSLYGHLRRTDLISLQQGQIIRHGQQLGAFGNSAENGSWPPHLHFQLMFDIGYCVGDYPGVGYFSKNMMYLNNIPDPGLLLNFPLSNIVRDYR